MFKLEGEKSEALSVYNLPADVTLPANDVVSKLVLEDFFSAEHAGLKPNFLDESTLCTPEMKLCHRRLLLGEPLRTDLLRKLKHPLAYGLDSWSPMSVESVLSNAVDIAAAGLDVCPEYNDYTESDDASRYLFRIVMLTKIFVQLNYTGPEVQTESVKKYIELLENVSKREPVTSAVKKHLELDGIEVESNVRVPALLPVIKCLLTAVAKEVSNIPYYLIWRFRVEFLHQKALTRRSGTLSHIIRFCAENLLAWFEKHDLQNDEVLSDVYGMFMCEISEVLTYYYDGLLSNKFLDRAKEILGLEVKFTGKSGYRTKFQQTPKTQTIVELKVLEKRDGDSDGDADPSLSDEAILFPFLAGLLPRSQPLNDETRLERVRLEDEAQVVDSHRAIHQLVVVGVMLHKRGFQEDKELSREEIEALVNVVLDNPVSWNGRVSALALRCFIEKYDRRAIDRSMRQLEHILKLVSHEAAEVPPRQYLFFGSGHPQKHELQVLFGEVLEVIDHWKEALNIYISLNMWEKIIKCYKMLSLSHKAEEVIRNKIKEDGESPKLLVLLGDATSDISHYSQAVTLSEGKSFEAFQRLGQHYFSRREFKESLDYLKKAVELAPLEYPSWLKLAWASYQLEDYEAAMQAYLYAANMEYDNFQVWSNLATCAVKLDRKKYALRAYKEAVKCNYDEWKLWSNLLVVAAELKEVNDAVNAYHRILDLKPDFSDETIIAAMVDVVADNPKPKVAMVSSLAKLLGRITSSGTRGAMTWLMYGRLLCTYLSCDSQDYDDTAKVQSFCRGLFNYNKALTLMRQNPRWKTDPKVLHNVVLCLSEFREQRCVELPQDCTENKAYDTTIKEVANSTFRVVEDLRLGNETDELLLRMSEEMKKELSDGFYAEK